MNMQRDAQCVKLCERQVYQFLQVSRVRYLVIRVSHLTFYLDSVVASKSTRIQLCRKKTRKKVNMGDSLASQSQILYNCIALKERAGKQANALFVKKKIMKFVFKLKTYGIIPSSLFI